MMARSTGECSLLPIAASLALAIGALGCGEDEAKGGATRSAGSSAAASEERGEREPLARAGSGSTPVQWRAPEGAGAASRRGGGGGGGGGGGAGERIDRDNLGELPPGAMNEDEATKAANEIAKTDRDGTPCAKAYEVFDEMLTAYQKDTPTAPRRKPERGSFMDMCESLPPSMQRCLMPDYLQAHHDECETVRKTFGGQMQGLGSDGGGQ